MISAPILKRTGKLACYQEAADRGQGWRKDEDEEKKNTEVAARSALQGISNQLLQHGQAVVP